MTDFMDCLSAAAMKGALNAGKADEARAMFNDFVRDMRAQGMDEQAAKTAAATKSVKRVTYQVERQKKLLVLGNTVRQRVLADMRAYRTPAGKESFADAAIAMIERDEYGTSTSYSGKKAVIEGEAHKRMVDILEAFSPKKVGLVRPKAGMDNMLEEIFARNSGKETPNSWRDTIDMEPGKAVTGDDAAKEMAEAWARTADYLRERANLAGSDIKVREDWNVPIDWDWARVSKMGKQPFTEYMLKHADFARMWDPDTGDNMGGMDIQSRINSLGKAYDTIKTQGYVNMDGNAAGSGSLANRMNHARFIQLKDAASWKEVNGALGAGTVFDAMVNHISHMSQQIAMLETFGPNPEMMRRYIKAQVRKRAGEIDAADAAPSTRLHVNDEDKKLRTFDAMWGTITNQNSVLNGDWLGFTLAGVRNLLTSAHLGSASLVAIPGDFLSVKMAKKFNNIEGTRFMGDYLKLMNPANVEDRKLAVRLNLISESATSIAYGQQRLLGQVTGPQFTRRIADVVMRASLMTPHTQAGRWAFGMEFLGAVADNVGKGFDEVPFKNTLKRHGITAQEWDAIRKTPLYEEQGATFLRPDDIVNNSKLAPSQAQALSDKLMEMVIGESRVAIQEPTIRARSFLISDSKPGTLIGELGRSGAMFKNFPVTMMMIHSRRNLLNAAMGGSKMGYAAAFGLGLTMMGALSTQLRQVTQGKDPMNMNPMTAQGRLFWGNATLTGGGLGIWGDFLFKDTNRFGGSKAETAAGPVVGWASDTVKLTVGNLMNLAKGEDTNFGAEAVQYSRRYLPGGSLWYARLALQRAVFDQLQMMVDDKAHQKFKRQAREMRKDYGQQFYQRPGEILPNRAPNLGAAWQN